MSYPTEIFIVRHAHTDRPPGFLDGLDDPSVSILGRGQAVALGRYIGGLGLDVIVTSPSRRTYETATHAAGGLSIPVEKDDGLSELDWGCAAGKSVAEAFPPDVDKRLDAEGLSARYCQHSQSYLEVAQQLAEVIARYRGERALFVTHGAKMKGLFGAMLGWSRFDTRKFPVPPAAVFSFDEKSLEIPRQLFPLTSHANG